MKINNELIKRIYEDDIKKRIKLSNKNDIIKLSKYEELIPMYDIYSEKIYPIKKENIYYRLIYCHYRFINDEVKQWIINQSKKNPDKHKYNLNIISNYDIKTLMETSLKVLYNFSPELGLAISICKRNSFNKFSSHLLPYYSRNELIKLGYNMGILKENSSININDEKIHYKICKKISKNDISSEEIQSHNNFIIENDLITLITNYSFMGSYFMNKYLREDSGGSDIIVNVINKLGKILTNTPPLKNDYFLYRFIWDDSFLTNLKKGDIFVDQGFISTTRDPFYSPTLKSNFGLILIKIKIPSNKNIGLLIENYSLFPKEEEFLLPPYSKLKLVSKDDKFKYYHTNNQFEKLINRKYEFEYVGNEFKEINQLVALNQASFKSLSLERNAFNSKIDILNNFVKENKRNDSQSYTINLNFKDRNYTIYYYWFDGTDSYDKFYYNKNKNGIIFIIYDETFYPYLNIEFGDDMVVNYLNQFYFKNVKKSREIDEIDMDLLFSFCTKFMYSNFRLYLKSDNFSGFSDNYEEKVNSYLYNNLFNSSLYDYLKSKNKFYSNLDKYQKFFKLEYGYWKLDKLKNSKIPKELHQRYKNISNSNTTFSDLIITIIEKHFYEYKKLIEKMSDYPDVNPFDKLFLIVTPLSIIAKEIPYDSNLKDTNDEFNLVFNQPIRRLV